jgi:hypothetical protein
MSAIELVLTSAEGRTVFICLFSTIIRSHAFSHNKKSVHGNQDIQRLTPHL